MPPVGVEFNLPPPPPVPAQASQPPVFSTSFATPAAPSAVYGAHTPGSMMPVLSHPMRTVPSPVLSQPYASPLAYIEEAPSPLLLVLLYVKEEWSHAGMHYISFQVHLLTGPGLKWSVNQKGTQVNGDYRFSANMTDPGEAFKRFLGDSGLPKYHDSSYRFNARNNEIQDMMQNQGYENKIISRMTINLPWVAEPAFNPLDGVAKKYVQYCFFFHFRKAVPKKSGATNADDVDYNDKRPWVLLL